MSWERSWPAANGSEEMLASANPLAVTEILYVLGASPSTAYRPSLAGIVLRTAFVASLVIVIFALGTTAPDESYITPVIRPRSDWAVAEPIKTNMVMTYKSSRFIICRSAEICKVCGLRTVNYHQVGHNLVTLERWRTSLSETSYRIYYQTKLEPKQDFRDRRYQLCFDRRITEETEIPRLRASRFVTF
jgi:hypothetical protein